MDGVQRTEPVLAGDVRRVVNTIPRARAEIDAAFAPTRDALLLDGRRYLAGERLTAAESRARLR